MAEVGVFLAPAVALYLVFVIVPVLLAAYYSFFNWNGLEPLNRFIGLDNYTRPSRTRSSAVRSSTT